MKNGALLLALIIGILIGYLICNFSSSKTDDDNVTLPNTITVDEAKHQIDNYQKIMKSDSVCAVLISETDLDHMKDVMHADQGNGVRFYFAAQSANDSNYNGLIIVATQDGDDIIPENRSKSNQAGVFVQGEDSGGSADDREVYYISTDPSHTGLCPPICDAKSPLTPQRK